MPFNRNKHNLILSVNEMSARASPFVQINNFIKWHLEWSYSFHTKYNVGFRIIIIICAWILVFLFRVNAGVGAYAYGFALSPDGSLCPKASRIQILMENTNNQRGNGCGAYELAETTFVKRIMYMDNRKYQITIFRGERVSCVASKHTPFSMNGIKVHAYNI